MAQEFIGDKERIAPEPLFDISVLLHSKLNLLQNFSLLLML